LSLSEQALHLLDIQPSIQNRRKLENFSSLESEIDSSIESLTAPPIEDLPLSSLSTPFALAARMDRPQYEEQAKAEALMNALRQMRAKSNAKSSPRVIRGT
jgi:predicted transposase YdaD